MTITSTEALDGADAGIRINVASGTGTQRGVWTKMGDGLWEREGVTLPATMFVGYINQGQVTIFDNRPAEPGDWYTHGNNDYYMVSWAADNQSTNTAVFQGGRWNTMHEYRPGTFDGTRIPRVEGLPDRVRDNPDAMQRLTQIMGVELSRLRVLVQQQRDAVTAAEALAAQTTTEATRPQSETVIVTALVRGVSTIPAGRSREALGDVAEGMQVNDAITSWSFTSRYSVDAPEGACSCSTYDTRKAERKVPANTTAWDAEVTCTSTVCVNRPHAEAETPADPVLASF